VNIEIFTLRSLFECCFPHLLPWVRYAETYRFQNRTHLKNVRDILSARPWTPRNTAYLDAALSKVSTFRARHQDFLRPKSAIHDSFFKDATHVYRFASAQQFSPEPRTFVSRQRFASTGPQSSAEGYLPSHTFFARISLTSCHLRVIAQARHRDGDAVTGLDATRCETTTNQGFPALAHVTGTNTIEPRMPATQQILVSKLDPR